MLMTRKVVKEQTAKMRDQENRLSSKGAKALELCKTFGCHTQKVTALVSFLIQEDLPSPIGYHNDGFIPYTAVVPLKNPNDHCYPIGEVAVVVDSVYEEQRDRAIRIDGKLGNHLPRFKENDCPLRYATDDEIDRYFDALESAA